MIGMRVEQPHELEIFVVIHPPQRHRTRPRDHRQCQAGIGGMRPVVDASEYLTDLVGCDKGALLDGFARPRGARLRGAACRPIRFAYAGSRSLRSPVSGRPGGAVRHPVRLALGPASGFTLRLAPAVPDLLVVVVTEDYALRIDRKITRLNSSHLVISYAVFCLKTN